MAEFPAVIRIIKKTLGDAKLVVMNVEPFDKTTANGRNVTDILKKIEIDRPVLIRAAAARYEDVAVVVDPADYDLVQTEIAAHGDITIEVRRRLAIKAFAYVATYDAAIAHWLAVQAGIIFPELITVSGKLVERLRYGENPHQSAAFYRTADNRPGVATANKVHGKQLSYNNINDTDAAYECVAEFDPARTAACVIVKHGNPCGVAEGSTLTDAYYKALRCDPTSAFGGIVAVNRRLNADAALAITKIFTEVIIAPDASEEAIAIVRTKKNLRLLLAGSLPDPRAPSMILKSVAGGFVIQPRDNVVIDDVHLKTVSKRDPTEEELRDLQFAFRVVKHVKSNAIVYAKNKTTVGIGAGQMSRLDAVELAARKSERATDEAGLKEPLAKDSVVASDAFFPFADGLLAAIKAGATAVIQPGGSVRDDEIIKAVDDHDIAMVFTEKRHFRH